MHAACVLARTSECSQARADSPWRVQSVTDHAAAVRQGHAAGLAGILGRRPADGVAVLDRDPCARCTGKHIAANAPIFTCRARHHCCPVRGAVTKLLPPRAARDPNYALAYCGLADAYAMLGFRGGFPSKDALLRAKAAALKAIELDDTLAEPHAALAFIAETHEWDWATAEREYKRALELNPGDARAHHWYD